MCDLCDSDVYSLADGTTVVGHHHAARVRIVGDQPQPLSVLSEETTAMIADIERHLDTERDEFRRRQLIDTMHSLLWARENLACLIDGSRFWSAPPRTDVLIARYPNPADQPA